MSDGSHGDHGSSPSGLGSDVYLSSLQRQAKYSENKLKCTKARNDYLLNLAATNAAISKYYIHDVSDLIDVSNLGILGPGEGYMQAATSHQLEQGRDYVGTFRLVHLMSWWGWG